MPTTVAVAGTSRYFDVYGLRIAIEGDWPEVVDALSQDFAWFARHPGSSAVAAVASYAGSSPASDQPPATDVAVTIKRCPPDPGRFGSIPQAFITTRNVVYQSGGQTIVDYSGRALAVYDRDRDRFTVEGEDEQLVHESAYLFMLSRVGRHLDASRLTRIHALGLSGRQGAVLVLLPSGGGKTTLALRALTDPKVKLLSEDTPVLDRRGWVHPFPLRMGINEPDADMLPPELIDNGHLRRIERLEFGPKLLLSLDGFDDAIESNPQPLRHLVIGRRWLAGGGTLAPLPRRAMIGPLIRDGVVGLGVAQMIEYVLRQGPGDLLGQGGVAASRAVGCARALSASRAWRLELARDPERNWRALSVLLE